MKKLFKLLIVLSALSFILSACGNTGGENNGTATQSTASDTASSTSLTESTAIDFSNDNEALKSLLPGQTGYVWIYNGFAEYGHRMTLNNISQTNNYTLYSITGMVDDMSGGEAQGDFTVDVEYVIKEGKLIQNTDSPKQLDNEFESLILLQVPLQQGTTWTQQAINKDGVEVQLECTIIGVIENGLKTYVVEYNQSNSDYYEIRQIREDTGIISFTKLFISGSDKFEIGYFLYEEVSGYPGQNELKSFLPPFDTELRYYGLAEYAHRVKWTNTSFQPGQTVYEFKGSFEDGSGIPGDFTVNYILDKNNFTITEKVVGNTRSGQPKINSVISDMIVLKAPVTPGNSWQQQVAIDGSNYTLNAVITGGQTSDLIPGALVYTVKYTVDDIPGYFNNKLIQERKFITGRGMTGFSQLMPGDIGISGKELDDKLLVEQAMANHTFGYSQDLTR